MARRTLLLIARRAAVAAFALLTAGAVPVQAAGHGGDQKMDASLRARAHAKLGTSRVIIETVDGSPSDSLIRSLRGRPGRRLGLLRGQVAEIPDSALDELAGRPGVRAVRLDRRVHGTLERTGATIGATWARENLGVDGSGIGVAIVDSGVTSWHDDLGSQRVVHFADFVDFQPVPYDDYGHGTHVAGIIAGNGYDSNGARRGIAPGANLVVLKVLDGDGNGYISNVIAALDYAVAHRAEFNIRVVNLSVAAGVYESYNTDPLTLAARRAVEAGVVVVTAAGNFGRNAKGQPQNGGVTAPGNAPWVLTVGATSHNGTAARADDSVAPFSSRGPSRFDHTAKPDVVAPGVGIESLADGSSLLFATHPLARLWGTVDTVTQPYLSLTGTSMAAPVVAGTIALMLQANPALTPNLVKAILQYTAEHRKGYDALTQGAGFLNARGAVQLARRLGGDLATPATAQDPTPWNAHINWGNHRIGGGTLQPGANAWRLDVPWGASTTSEGESIIWGAVCGSAGCDNSGWEPKPVAGSSGRGVWGAFCTDSKCANIVWGTSTEEDNIVWGTACGGEDCPDTVWSTSCDDHRACAANIVWGTSADEEDNIVWGTSCETLVPSCGDVVWSVPAIRQPRPSWRAPSPRHTRFE
jgi:subtilisin family serine protease